MSFTWDIKSSCLPSAYIWKENLDKFLACNKTSLLDLVRNISSGKTSPLIDSFCVDVLNYRCFDIEEKNSNEKLAEFIVELLTAEKKLHNYAEKLKKYDFSTRCGLVWTVNYFAYRCRTCSLSPSMSLCSDCFTAGNHQGHDFNKFKSQAGGACDCGDPYVMKEMGNCPHHGPTKLDSQVFPPDDLVAPLKTILPQVLCAVLYRLWRLLNYYDDLTNTNTKLETLSPVMDLLHELLACGWVTQKMIADFMIDCNAFSNFCQSVRDSSGYRNYEQCMSQPLTFTFPADKVFDQKLVHRTFLDAYLHACVQLNFPETLSTFLIGLLTIEDYKLYFVDAYVNHYSRITEVVINVVHHRRDHVSHMINEAISINNRIVHISVQLFSGEVLALKKVKERNLHYLMIHCLLNLFNTCKKALDDNGTQVIDCDREVIQENVFWPLVSDFINLVSHKSVVEVMVHDKDFLTDWAKTLQLMQFMNLYIYQYGSHVEYESNSMFYAYMLEFELSANPMWNFWNHFRQQGEADNCLRYTEAMLQAVGEHLDNVGDLIYPTSIHVDSSSSPPVLVSRESARGLTFHLPLQRHAACFSALCLVQHGLPLSRLIAVLSPQQTEKWLWWSLRTLLGSREVNIGFWTRNGIQLRNSALYYVQNQFCYAFIDLDIFAIQLCACILPSSCFFKIMTDPGMLLRGVDMKLGTALRTRGQLDREANCLEAWLEAFCWILDLRTNMEVPESVILRKELICLLSCDSRKRSNINSYLPDRSVDGVVHNVDDILSQVASYSAPSCNETSGNLQSGLYTIKPSVMHDEFDPVFQSLRSVYRKDYVKSLLNYKKHLSQKLGKDVASPWPPFRIPEPIHPQLKELERLLHSRDLHYILYSCLQMFLFEDPQMTEDSLVFVIHLIKRALLTPNTFRGSSNDSCYDDNPYTVDDFYINLITPVPLYLYEPLPKEPEFREKESLLSLIIKCHSLLSAASSISSVTNQAGAAAPNRSSQEKRLMPRRLSSSFDKIFSRQSSDNFPSVMFKSSATCIMGDKFYNYIPMKFRLPSSESIQNTDFRESPHGNGIVHLENLLNLIYSLTNSSTSEALVAEVKRILRILNVDAETGTDTYNSETVSKASTPEDPSREERKRRAQERQKKLMEKMASKQKLFASIHKDIIIKEDEDVTMTDISAISPEQPKEIEYECVICQVTTSVKDAANPMVVLAFASPIGVSNQLRSLSEVPQLDLSKPHRMVKIMSPDSRLRLAKEVVASTSPSMKRQAFRSAIIQNCGHCMHKICFENYRKQRLSEPYRSNQSIRCPLCRRDVNHLIPLLHDPMIDYSHSDIPHLLNRMAFAYIYDESSRSFLDMIESLDTFYSDNREPGFKEIFKNPAQLLRNQLEMELIVFKLYPHISNSVTKRCPWREYISYLLSLSERQRNDGHATYHPQILYSLTGTYYDEEDDIMNPCPAVLVLDPVDVFLSWVPFSWPDLRSFNLILKAVFNLSYVRALFSLVMKLTDERKRSLIRDKEIVATLGQPLAAHLKSAVEQINRYNKVNELTNMDTARPPYNQEHCHPDTYLPQIKTHMLPLLRIASVAMAKWKNQPLHPCLNESPSHSDEFNSLCESLGLVSSSPESKSSVSYSSTNPGVIVDQSQLPIVKDFNLMLASWLNPIIEQRGQFGRERSSNILFSELLDVSTQLYPPRLVALPNSYDEIFNRLHTVKCQEKSDHATFPENSLCLICGKLMCQLCSSSVTRHIECCGSGIGIYLEINTSIIHLRQGNQGAAWGSVFLDTYGEEDLELRRGKPLYLDTTRYNLLEQQWLSYSFRQSSKQFHRV